MQVSSYGFDLFLRRPPHHTDARAPRQHERGGVSFPRRFEPADR
ncbi:hypothetical protein [Dactylosporangium sp. NPDC051541]